MSEDVILDGEGMMQQLALAMQLVDNILSSSNKTGKYDSAKIMVVGRDVERLASLGALFGSIARDVMNGIDENAYTRPEGNRLESALLLLAAMCLMWRQAMAEGHGADVLAPVVELAVVQGDDHAS